MRKNEKYKMGEKKYLFYFAYKREKLFKICLLNI